MKKEMLTTKEIAEYLSINEKQVYQLIKNKKIPATRITGKWLFPRKLVEEWLIVSAKENVGVKPTKFLQNQVVIAGSNDLALELLAKKSATQNPQFTVSISTIGSMGGIVALQNKACHIAASHLLDAESGEYNIPFLRKHLSTLELMVINVIHREQGLIVQKGNPHHIETLKDLAGPKLNFINRQEGSGTRTLFDFQLKKSGIYPEDINGYSHIAFTHLEVALEILSGSADVGVGILAVARLCSLDFIPLQIERFDFIILKECYELDAVQALLTIMKSSEFKDEVNHLGGYDTAETGKVLYEKS